MTVSTTGNRVSYAGNGVTTVFSFPNKFLLDTDIVVLSVVDATGVSTTKILTTDYTLTGAGGPAGGNVTMLVAPATGTTLVIYRDPPLTQPIDPVNGDPLNVDTTIEAGLDRSTLALQRVRDLIDRSLHIPDGDTGFVAADLAIPAKITRASKFLAFDADGKPMVATSPTAGSLVVSSYIETLLDDVDAATALSTLGVTSFVQTLLNDATSNAFLTTLTTTRSETGAVAITVLDKLRRDTIYPEDFGAVGDGATDDLTPLTNFINALNANTSRRGQLLAKTYATSAALPNITANGFELIGFGPSASHDVGSASGSVIKKIGAVGGTMLTVAPVEGASAQALVGVRLDGVTFDCNSLAEKGLVLKSIRYSDVDVTVYNATTTGMELGVATTLGEARDTQYNRFRYIGRQIEAAGISLRLLGDATANTSFNWFELVDISHKDAFGVVEDNADNNVWGLVRILRAGGGTATNSIEWRGGATEPVSCRAERFLSLSTTVAAIAKGTGTYVVGAKNIFIDRIDTDNGTPVPTIETGATIYDNQWRSFTPVLSAGSGAFTVASATGRYRPRIEKSVEVQVVVTITTNGTAAGFVRTTLPVNSSTGANTQTFSGAETSVTGLMLRGVVNPNSANVDTTTAAGVYPGGDGRALQFNGLYEPVA